MDPNADTVPLVLSPSQWAVSKDVRPPVVSGELVLRGERRPARRLVEPPRRKTSLAVLLGVRDDPFLIESGMSGHRVYGEGTGRTWNRRKGSRDVLRRRYEHPEQAHARQDLRARQREFRGRLHALKVAMARLLGLDMASDLRMTVPLPYATPTAATGDVRLKWGLTRAFDREVDPFDAPRLAPVVLELPRDFGEAQRHAVTGLVAQYLGGDWAPVWRLDVHPARAEFHRLAAPNTELEARIRALCLVIGEWFGLEPWKVELDVPREYENRRYGREEPADPEPEDLWLDDPDRPEDQPDPDGIEPVRLVLPDTFTGALKNQVTALIAERLGGEWSPRWYTHRHPMRAELTRKLVQPRPPEKVDWELSPNKYSIYVGKTGKKKMYVETETETPHWAVSAGSGGGKTTTLLLPAIHWRAYGGLIDIIDMKQKSFAGFLDDISGFRVHSTTTHAVAAFGEFLLSALAVDNAKDRGYDPSLIPPRIMLCDEWGSFVKYAEIWWRDVLGEKGKPPVKAWFHIGLMQGRTKEHRFVVGTHDFAERTFDGTGPRDLLGTKLLIGPISNPKWVTTFGYDYKKVKHQSKKVGRAVMGITGAQPEEVQVAYAGEAADVNALLSTFDPAPAWFDRGEVAPWISEADIEMASEAVNIAPFLPGGEYVPNVINLRTQLPSPTHVQREHTGLGDLEAPEDQPEALRLVESAEELEARENAREVGFREAMTDRLLPLLAAAVRADNPDSTATRIVTLGVERLRNYRKKDKAFPEPVGRRGQEILYLVGDLRLWEKAKFGEQTPSLSVIESGNDSAESTGA